MLGPKYGSDLLGGKPGDNMNVYGCADYRCVSDSSKDTSSNNNGTGNVLDSLTVDDWNWFFPFRFGHKNSNGGSYNSGKEACELLGLSGTVESNPACVYIYILIAFKNAC